jgi:hypothetical protein
MVMSEHDFLHRWLARAAARMRACERLRVAGLLACALLGLLALRLALRALLPVPPVLAALTPLFLLAALACVAVFGWLFARRVTLAQAAAAADARAGLNDELKSAYWLGEPAPREGIVALLLQRACDDARRLDARRLFPLRTPSTAVAALGLGALCAALGGLVPQIAETAPVAVPLPQSSNAHRAGAPAPGDAPAAHTDDRQRALWSALDQLAERITGSAQAEAIRRAVAARDAQRAAQLVNAMQRRDAAAAAQDARARPEGEQMTAELAQGILERLQELMRGEEDGAPAAGAPPAPQDASRLAEQLRQDLGDAERGRDERGSQGEMLLNAMLRAISRTTQGERPLAQGGGEAGEESGRAQTSGGAMGRRVSRTRAGGNDGEQATGDPAGELEADPVLGARTQRLQAQLHKARVERSADDDDAGGEGREDSFYDATQAQAAQLALRDVAGAAHPSGETPVAGQQTPLAYRDAVKRYSLSQHRKESVEQP